MRRARAELTIEFADARLDDGPGGALAQAMRDEIALMYDGLELDGDGMPRAGQAELSPPGGGFIVGCTGGLPVCCGGVKRLDDRICEIKSKDFNGNPVASFWGEKPLRVSADALSP